MSFLLYRVILVQTNARELQTSDARCNSSVFSDHMCPWTGTAIGKGNAVQFRLFVYGVYTMLLFDVVLAVHSSFPQSRVEVVLGVICAIFLFGGAVCCCTMKFAVDEAHSATKTAYGSVQRTGVEIATPGDANPGPTAV